VNARIYMLSLVDVGTRYRYVSRLVTNFGQGLNTTETRLSVGYRFQRTEENSDEVN
jgi:hypothetical protein